MGLFLALVMTLTLIPVTIAQMMWGWGVEPQNWGWITFGYVWAFIIPNVVAVLVKKG